MKSSISGPTPGVQQWFQLTVPYLVEPHVFLFLVSSNHYSGIPCFVTSDSLFQSVPGSNFQGFQFNLLCLLFLRVKPNFQVKQLFSFFRQFLICSGVEGFRQHFQSSQVPLLCRSFFKSILDNFDSTVNWFITALLSFHFVCDPNVVNCGIFISIHCGIFLSPL